MPRRRWSSSGAAAAAKGQGRPQTVPDRRGTDRCTVDSRGRTGYRWADAGVGSFPAPALPCPRRWVPCPLRGSWRTRPQCLCPLPLHAHVRRSCRLLAPATPRTPGRGCSPDTTYGKGSPGARVGPPPVPVPLQKVLWILREGSHASSRDVQQQVVCLAEIG
jgi:hypothetical protein